MASSLAYPDLLVAPGTEWHRTFQSFRGDTELVRRVRVMAAGTGELPAFAERVGPLVQRVAVVRADPGQHVLGRYVVVARITVVLHERAQDKGGIRPVRIVAGEALACRGLDVGVLLSQSILVVAGEAEVRDRCDEHSRIIARMGIMARPAHASGNRGVQDLFIECRLVMAGEAEVRNGCRELRRRLFALMVADMARAAPHVNRRMHHLPFSFIGMAVET